MLYHILSLQFYLVHLIIHPQKQITFLQIIITSTILYYHTHTKSKEEESGKILEYLRTNDIRLTTLQNNILMKTNYNANLHF